MAQNCLFCSISKRDPSFFWQNQHFKALLDAYPVTPGHFLIIPKRHRVSIEDLNQTEWNNLYKAIIHAKKAAAALNLSQYYNKIIDQELSDKSIKFCERSIKEWQQFGSPTSYNIGVNDGKDAGRTIDHLHIQIIPRYPNDVTDPTGGVRGVIPQRQNYR